MRLRRSHSYLRVYWSASCCSCSTLLARSDDAPCVKLLLLAVLLGILLAAVILLSEWVPRRFSLNQFVYALQLLLLQLGERPVHGFDVVLPAFCRVLGLIELFEGDYIHLREGTAVLFLELVDAPTKLFYEAGLPIPLSSLFLIGFFELV